jgi:hypothetical protein
MTGIPLIRIAAMLPKGIIIPPMPPPPQGDEGVTNEEGEVVVNEFGDAPIGGD